MAITPRFYKIDLQKLTLSELIFFTSVANGFWLWLLKTVGLIQLPTTSGHFFPTVASDLTLDEKALSEQSLAHFLPLIEGFQRLGFLSPIFEKPRPTLDPNFQDAGGCFLLHQSGNFVASLVYLRLGNRDSETGQFDRLLMTVGVKFSSGKSLVVVNLNQSFDPFRNLVLNRVVFHKKTTSPTLLFSYLENLIKDRFKFDQIVKIQTLNELAQLLEEESIRVLQEGLKQNRYIEMTDEEIESAKDSYQRERH